MSRAERCERAETIDAENRVVPGLINRHRWLSVMNDVALDMVIPGADLSTHFQRSTRWGLSIIFINILAVLFPDRV